MWQGALGFVLGKQPKFVATALAAFCGELAVLKQHRLYATHLMADLWLPPLPAQQYNRRRSHYAYTAWPGLVHYCGFLAHRAIVAVFAKKGHSYGLFLGCKIHGPCGQNDKTNAQYAVYEKPSPAGRFLVYPTRC